MRANETNRLRGWSTGLAIALLALGLALILMGRKLVEYQVFEVPVFTVPLENPDRMIEVRTARGDWARSLPSGEDVSVHLTLDGEVVAPDDSSQAELLSLSGVYSSNAPQVEARLEMRDVTIHPTGSILQPLVPSQPANLYWRINAPRAGAYEGTLWVYLNFAQPGVEPNHQLVLARPVTLTATDVLGLPPYQVRNAGWIFLGLALVAALPVGRSLFIRYGSRVRNERAPGR